jgi:nitrogen regulatory protein PII
MSKKDKKLDDSMIAKTPAVSSIKQDLEAKRLHEQKVSPLLQSIEFEMYVKESGLQEAFQIILSEIITKKIAENQVFVYTAMISTLVRMGSGCVPPEREGAGPA